jgi:hypothetical protein
MKRLCVLSILLLIAPIASATDTDGDGFDDDVDHRDDEDAHVILSLNYWNANSSEEWDNDDGAPDPYFEVCVDADDVRVDCFDSPKWLDTFSLGQDWNLTVNIPDDSSLVKFTIECRDDDIANDDECDMNNESGEWKLIFIFDWLSNPSSDFLGSGFGDDEVESRNAVSNWTVFSPSTVIEIPDTDGDGVNDENDAFPQDVTQWYDGDGDGYGDNLNGINPDRCRDSPPAEPVDSDGCTQSQIADSDGDGVLDISDECSNTAENVSVDTSGCPVVNEVKGEESFLEKWGFGWVASVIAALFSITLALITYNRKKKNEREDKSRSLDMHSDIRDIKREVEHTEQVVEEISERV